MTTQGSPTAWEPELFPGRDPELVRGPAPWQRSLTDRTPRGPSGGGGRPQWGRITTPEPPADLRLTLLWLRGSR